MCPKCQRNEAFKIGRFTMKFGRGVFNIKCQLCNTESRIWEDGEPYEDT